MAARGACGTNGAANGTAHAVAYAVAHAAAFASFNAAVSVLPLARTAAGEAL